jgi:hypothetical protein
VILGDDFVVTRVLIGVVLLGEASIRLVDFRFGGGANDPQDFVVAALFSHFRSQLFAIISRPQQRKTADQPEWLTG